jgi:hypothetical protein
VGIQACHVQTALAELIHRFCGWVPPGDAEKTCVLMGLTLRVQFEGGSEAVSMLDMPGIPESEQTPDRAAILCGWFRRRKTLVA